MVSIEAENVGALVKRYAESATAYGRATETGDHKAANTAHEALAEVYRELRRRGVDAQRELLTLLGDSELGVRAWAGAHALEFAPADGERVLLQIADIPRSLVSFSVKMTLQQWREGKLRFL